MSDDIGATPEIIFRAKKRRKIFPRRNADSGGDEDEATRVESLADASAASSAEGAERVSSLVKRPNTKTRGVKFSSVGIATAEKADEMPLVPYEEANTADLVQSDRFVKPSSGVRVVENKHLTAYVDSKLAEMRSYTSLPQSQDLDAARTSLPEVEGEHSDSHGTPQDPTATQPSPSLREPSQRGRTTSSRSQTRRPRRQPPARDEGAIARESMVDQILAESEIPMYDRSKPAGPAAGSSSQDADEAAAQAFKEQFLVDLAQRNRRRRPPPAASAGAKGAQASTGPKLGGSRSQREKMKALEEAQKTAGKR